MTGRFGALLALSTLLSACAAGPAQQPTHADAESQAAEDSSEETAGGPSSWSEVEPLSTSEEKPSRVSKRKVSIEVRSDPNSHGPQLDFNFTVDGLAMNGIFSVPGGKTYTFSLPAGVISYTVDQCSAGEGGFELEPGQRATLICSLTSEGDCCETLMDEEGPADDEAQQEPAPAE